MTNSNNIRPLAELCGDFGLDTVFISPGARSAPIVIAFAQSGRFRMYVVNDERASAFIALGYTKGSGKPTILICTSGSAILNYAPSIIEACESDIPLLIISADRPKSSLHQFEGQTTVQDQIFLPWGIPSYTLEGSDFSINRSYAIRLVNEALHKLNEPPNSPVHLNIHLHEPLFTTQNDVAAQLITKINPLKHASPDLLDGIISKENRVLAVAGTHLSFQLHDSDDFLSWLYDNDIPIVAEPASFRKTHADIIYNAEDILTFSKPELKEKLSPRLIISWGGNIVSKKLKNYLKSLKNVQNIHLDAAGRSVDQFGCLSKVVKFDPYHATYSPQKLILKNAERQAFRDLWKDSSQIVRRRKNTLLSEVSFGDISAVSAIMDVIPENTIIHLGNSMPIRYFYELFEIKKKNYQVSVNRGVSGIDGTLGTAVGLALASEPREVWCILGDVSFHHGINALWGDHIPFNLKVFILKVKI